MDNMEFEKPYQTRPRAGPVLELAQLPIGEYPLMTNTRGSSIVLKHPWIHNAGGERVLPNTDANVHP